MSGEVLDAMPPAQSSALKTQVNPYLGMVQTMVAQGGDLANLDKMLDLQLKWEANEARKAYVAAMAAFKAEPMEIFKRKLVSFKTNSGKTEYMHAELSDVTDTVVPAMGKHGLSHRWDVKQEGKNITVSCTITHALGHAETVTITAEPDTSGGKNAIQSVASTISYLERYTLLAATGMATKGMDDDGQTSEGNGGDTQADPVADKRADWIRVADGLEDPIEYEKQRTLMVADYGTDPKLIPVSVKTAFANAKARVTPRDVEE
jgi:hypothetical protein